jgi:hypothetical protein
LRGLTVGGRQAMRQVKRTQIPLPPIRAASPGASA